MCFFIRIGSAWKETHVKIHCFSKELELWEEETHFKIHCLARELELCGEPFENHVFFIRIGGVWEETHVKIHCF